MKEAEQKLKKTKIMEGDTDQNLPPVRGSGASIEVGKVSFNDILLEYIYIYIISQFSWIGRRLVVSNYFDFVLYILGKDYSGQDREYWQQKETCKAPWIQRLGQVCIALCARLNENKTEMSEVWLRIANNITFRIDIDAELEKVDKSETVTKENKSTLRHASKPNIPSTVESSSKHPSKLSYSKCIEWRCINVPSCFRKLQFYFQFQNKAV